VAKHARPATCGVDHVGLSVRDLESTRRFFCDCLGWRVVGERPEYAARSVPSWMLCYQSVVGPGLSRNASNLWTAEHTGGIAWRRVCI
jgi:catechol 2,3-dioxygenase-like lactoylglutathione lyase family enzyme